MGREDDEMTEPENAETAESAEVRRSVTPDDTAGVHTVVVEQTYPTDTADLWDAVSAPGRLAQWFLPVSGELRAGGRFQLEGHAGGTIEECDPPRSYAVTWESGDEVGRVRVIVTQEAGGTALRIEHDAPAGEHWDRFGPAAVGLGWEGSLRGLGRHLTSGAPLDPEAEMAWAMSAEGLARLGAGGQAWTEVTDAAGYDAT